MKPQDAERDRDTVLQCVFDHDERTHGATSLPATDIAEATGLSMRDVDYHLGILEREGALQLIRAQGGPHNVDALITSLGQQRAREGFRQQAPQVNIGAIIHQMSGGSVQSVGSAINSEVSQVVNDPGELRAALDELGEKILEAVREELQDRDLEAYTRALDNLKAELETRRDPGRMRKMLRTLALFGDVEGSIGLMVRLWPLVGAVTALAHGLGVR